jgi:LacI family kdg operon repressor
MGASKVTISNIAATAGVSKATVSRFINGKMDLISAPTRARIKKAIATTGYQPSAAARQLSLGGNSQLESDFVGLIIQSFESPTTISMVQRCFNQARSNGQSVLVSFADSIDGLDAIAKPLFAKGASAVFYACPEADELKSLQSRN